MTNKKPQRRRNSAIQGRDTKRRMNHETLEKRELLAADIGVDDGPRLIAVSANSGEQFDLEGSNVLPTAPTELTFRFGGELIDAATLAGIQFRRSGGDGSFNEGNEVNLNDEGQLGFIGFEQGATGNIIVARFAETLPDDQYIVEIPGYDDTNAGIVGLRDIDGDLICPPNPTDEARPVQEVRFDIEVGPRVLSVVPQPVVVNADGTASPNPNQIWVYFNDDPLSDPTEGVISTGSGEAVVNPQFYKLIFTNDTIETTDDPLPIVPSIVSYDPSINRAVLTFPNRLQELAPAAANGGEATYRLRIGSGDAIPRTAPIAVTADGSLADTFSDAQPLNVNFGSGLQSVLVNSGEIRSEDAFLSQWPGATDAVGSRDQRRDVALTGRIDTNAGINVFPYNFASIYGEDAQTGLPIDNAITPAQQERAREVLGMYSERLGVQFVETATEGLQIVTGDLRAITVSADTSAGTDTPLSNYRVSPQDPTQGVLILDAGENWYDGYGFSPDNRPSWFVEAVRGIGSLLGIGNLFELPEGVGAGGSSPDEPDSVSYSDVFYPDLPVEPSFLSHSDVTLGQALHRPESNDVDFYSFSTTTPGRLTAETFAERLDGASLVDPRRLDGTSLLDTHLNLYQLIDGDYTLIARNDDFYSDDSFIGIDVEAGDFVIGVSASGNENYNGLFEGSGLGGRSEGRYDLRVTFDGFTGTTITDTTGSALDGDADGIEGGDFNFWFRTTEELANANPGEARTIFVSKLGDDTDTGSLGSPLRSIRQAFINANEGDIVRLLPNGGADGLVTTPEDNLAYEIGVDGNRILTDGQEFEIPRGVTVMIEAGTILKLRTSKISVGSESADEDRSLAALQVLGTPVIVETDSEGNTVTGSGEVIITSYDNEDVAVDTNPSITTPIPGNWGGIEFRNDFDYAEGRPVWETEGIFLDFVSHANISYGGGAGDVGDRSDVNPIELAESRPTIIHNRISSSENAAISADPNSFLETNFHSPVFQRTVADGFTSDYQRVGPEIYGNTLTDNNINSLFVRVATPAGGQREELTVSARFDDTDIVHTLSEVLVVAGAPGGPQLLEERPSVLNATLTGTGTGTLNPSTFYSYKVSFVDVFGNESLASLATTPVASSSGGAIQLARLPEAPVNYAGRRLYRSIPGTTDFEFVVQLDRRAANYVDDGTTRGGLLRTEIRPENPQSVVFSDPAPIAGVIIGTLNSGASHDYRFTFVDAIGGESEASDPTSVFVVPDSRAIQLDNLPTLREGYVSMRVYRLEPSTGDYDLIADIVDGTTSLLDDGSSLGPRLINDGREGTVISPRYDARLSIDPGTIVKLQTGRIEVDFGADFYAEGTDGKEIVFTSRRDDRFGGSGTFDTNNDGVFGNAGPGDWSGLIFRADSTTSLDYVDIQFGGGVSDNQGSFNTFNAVEILQSNTRISNSVIRNNASGFAGESTRGGFGFNDESSIFVRGSQPILIDNIIESNLGAALSINPNAMNYDDVLDVGRSTGPVDLIDTPRDNRGPLILRNQLDDNALNGLRVRGETLTTESIWDDTDIVHVVEEQIVSLTHHFRSGLRLQSDPGRGLVVKYGPDGELVASGRPLDIDDRIGGTLQVMGTPGNPVILTSLNDCSVGAGFTPNGEPMNDTLNEGVCGGEGIFGPMIDQFNDTAPNIDEWIIVADDSGSITVQVFNSDQGLVSLDGQPPQTIDNETLTLRVPNTTPGTEYVFTHELIGGLAHYRPQFIGAEHVYIRENRTSPNDVFNSSSGTGTQIGSNLELGFDERWSALPSVFADTTWFYDLDAGDTITWRGFYDNFPGGADAIQVELIRPDGIVVQTVNNQAVFPGNGTQLSQTIPAGQGGFWGIKLTAPANITPYAGHYLMDVEVTDSNGNRDATKSERHYLTEDSFINTATGFAGPGDWVGLTIDTFANDRNVAHVLETERATPADMMANNTPDDAQFIGDLADHQYAGDETERLGFTVRGTLAGDEDIDVYRFTASGGTTVYFDIDDTSFGLDTVVELIDVTNSVVLARSDDSFAEATDQTTLGGTLLADDAIRPLFLTGNGNIEGPNPLDAGMRVILDGSSTEQNDYYIRVRSKRATEDPTNTVPNNTVPGLSNGQYTLSVRLQEADEVAGSTVQFADIRYATNAITVSGAPLHSPLSSDGQESLDFTTIVDPTPADPTSGDEFVLETHNNRLTFNRANGAGVEQLGNLLTSDRGSLVVTGEIGNISSIDADVRLEDIDVFQVELIPQQIEPDVFDDENRYVTVTFDVDFADGLGRPNTSLAVYNSFGQLILHGRDSNIADDVGRPTLGVDSSNLVAGSSGTLDAHIGPVELPAGTYYVAVSNAATVPVGLDQFFNPTTANPNLRLMPINSVRRIADDTLDEYDIETGLFIPDGDLIYTAERPILQPVFDTESILPYTLDDIRLFVSFDGGLSGPNLSSLAAFNPFTGVMERLIGQAGQPTGDIAIRRDGELFALSHGPAPGGGGQTNANTGNFLNISPVNAAQSSQGDDTTGFFRNNQAGTDMEADPNGQFVAEAVTFVLPNSSTRASVPNGEDFFAVGSRDNRGRGFEIPLNMTRNILYQGDATGGSIGEVTSPTSTDARFHRGFPGTVPYQEFDGPASDNRERGIIDTGNIFGTGGDGGDITGIAFVPEGSGTEFYAVTDNGGLHLFDYTNTVEGPLPNTNLFFNRGYPLVIPTTYFGLIERDPTHFGFGDLSFTGMAMGPRTTENGLYRDTIFATTDDNWLYAFRVNEQSQKVEPAHVFYDGRSAIPLVTESGISPSISAHGLAFSVLEENPWHQAAPDRGTDPGHGIEIPDDISRVGVTGGSSLYFGFERDGNPANNTLSPPDNASGDWSPGGSHGSVVTSSFNLEGYSEADKPTLYFSYFIEVENDDDYRPGNRVQHDSFRVFGSGDDGEWILLATNDDFRTTGVTDEYDYQDQTRIPVQELFDDRPEWRQARVDISPLAGDENVRIRFDVSTAGSMRPRFDSIDFVGVPGDEISDHEQITISDSQFNNILLEAVVGKNVVLPAGNALQPGDAFNITGPEGLTVVTFVSGSPTPNSTEVQFNAGMTADEVANAVLAVLPVSLNPSDNGDGSLSLLAATDVTPVGDAPVAQSNPVPVQTGTGSGNTLLQIPDGANLFAGESITISAAGGDTTLRFVNVLSVPAVAGEVFFTATDTAATIADRIVSRNPNDPTPPLLPVELGAIHEGDGVIRFVSPVTATTTASQSQIAVDNFRFVNENRQRISVADGDNLLDGEILRVQTASGVRDITFIDGAGGGVPGFVFFEAGDTEDEIADRLLDALPSDAQAIRDLDDVLIIGTATPVITATNITLGPVPATSVTFPTGDFLIDGEVLRFTPATGPAVNITFIESPNAGPAGTVNFQPGDSAGLIQARVQAALGTLNTIPGASGLVAYEVTGITPLNPASQITTSFVSGQQITIPAGGLLVNGEAVDVISGAGTQTITFVDQIAPGGPNEVAYQAADTGNAIANRFLSQLPTSVNGLVSGSTVFLSANAVVSLAGMSNTQVSSVLPSFTGPVTTLTIPDGNQLRSGEQIQLFGNGVVDVVTFIQRGSNVQDQGTIQVFFDRTDVAADLYDQIVAGLSANHSAYIDQVGAGINIYNEFGTTFATVLDSPPETQVVTQDLNRFAIPITFPNGAEINSGETITVTLKTDTTGFSAQTFTLVERGSAANVPGELLYNSGDTADAVTLDVLSQMPIAWQPVLAAPRVVNLLNASSAATETGSLVVGYESAFNAMPILVDFNMTSAEVAQRVQATFTEALGRHATLDGTTTATELNYPIFNGDRIRLYNQFVTDPGSFGISQHDSDTTIDPFSPLDTLTSVPADDFGDVRPLSFVAGNISAGGADNNEVEGVYLDDVIIGFAERGEMVLNAPLNQTNFTFNPETLPDTHPLAIQPERQNETLLGPYSLEIRTSDDYGVPEDYDPIRLELRDSIGLGRSFDTNDRLADGAVSLIVPAATDLVDGDTFVLDDGNRSLTFEFDADGTVEQGHVRIPYNITTIDPAFVATAVREAINSPQVQSILEILAATGDSNDLTFGTGNRVELFADSSLRPTSNNQLERIANDGTTTISVNPSGGRFLKVDLVDEETYLGRESSREIPIVDHTNGTVTDLNLGALGFVQQTVAAAVTDYVDGSVDTLVAVGKIGDQVVTGDSTQDGAILLPQLPESDVDMVRIYLEANQQVDIDVDTVGFSRASEVLDVPVISVLGTPDFGSIAVPTLFAQSSLTTPTSAPGEVHAGAFLTFQAPADGYYNVAISSAFGVGGGFFGFGNGTGEYQLTIRPHASAAVPARDVLMVDYQFGKGDVNRLAPQGQLIISSNFISDSANVGVLATNQARGATLASADGFLLGAVQPEALPRPGSPALLRNQNSDGLIPGVVISNNVVSRSGGVGIQFSGDTNPDGSIEASSLFGRIVNNTVVGTGAGSGIVLDGSASPTVLNNVVAFTDRGLVTTPSHTGDVVLGGNAYHMNNVADLASTTLTIGTSSFVVPNTDPLFQDTSRDIYIPAVGSDIIDSSFQNTVDRADFLQTVKEPVGIGPSPIIAPSIDAYGQERVGADNAQTPGGVGENPFIDRGAIDRADDTPPEAILIEPRDAFGTTVVGGDQDVDLSFVRLESGTVEFFEVQLTDQFGTGPDSDTITSENVILTENGRLLTPHIDYTFGYSSNSRTFRLTPMSGLWRPDSVYQITLNNLVSLNVTMPSGAGIVDGDQLVLTADDGTVLNLEFESGYSLAVPQSTLLNVTGTNASFQDQESLTITAPDGTVRVLEIDTDGATSPGNIPVSISAAGTIQEVRDAILGALESDDPLVAGSSVADVVDLAPRAIGLNRIQLGTTASHLVNSTLSGVAISGQLGSAGDGDRFTYSNGSDSVTFELTTDMLVGDPAFVPIPISRTSTVDEVATAIATVLRQDPLLGLSDAQAIGDGVVLIGGTAGDVLTLDQSAMILNGQPGVAPNATAVPFFPSSQFSPSSSAAAVQAAIAESGISVDVLSPGSGNLLISHAERVEATFGGTVLYSLGNRLQAVSDLAGNPVQETRVTQETRFTIIMPDVVFDYGDAPASFGTLDINNGARHTITADRTPRLGVHLDSDEDGAPNPGSDDIPLAIFASATGDVFSTSTQGSTTTISVISNQPALSINEVVTFSIQGQQTRFELTPASANPDAGNVAVRFVPGDSVGNIAENLAQTIRGAIDEIDEAIIMTVDANTATITLEAIDDEDGILIGRYFDPDDPLVSYQVFAVPGADLTNVDPNDVFGFVNPRDRSAYQVSVVGAGLLDAWVDFDQNGVFATDEQVNMNEPVVDGLNSITFEPPQGAARAVDGPTWMRVRVSEIGNLGATGVSVGGEVEDYVVDVLSLDPPLPDQNLTYTVAENDILVVNEGANDLIPNNANIQDQILPVRYFIGELPQNGTFTVVDETTGAFTYEPDDDFYGTDTFTYRLSTQRNAGGSSSSVGEFATVTINVTPVNDAPAAVDQNVTGVEGTTLVISADTLLAGSVGDGDPAIPNAPFDESDQTLYVTSIVGNDGIVIGVNSQTASSTTLLGGTLRATFRDVIIPDPEPNNPNTTDITRTVINEIFYTPLPDHNSDNLPVDDGLGNLSDLLDTFTYTVQDDGLLVVDAATQFQGSLDPADSTASANVFIRVAPTNDTPTLVTDTVSIADPNFLDFHTRQGLSLPVVLEDTNLVIPGQFLLENDFAADPTTAQDEIQSIRSNDGPLSIVGVSFSQPTDLDNVSLTDEDSRFGQITLLPDGNVEFIPAADVYGEIRFYYVAEDFGIDEDIDGNRVLNPQRAAIESVVFLEPVNDNPVAFDRSLTLDEVAEPDGPAVLSFTAAQLISGNSVPTTNIVTASDSIRLPAGAEIEDGERIVITGSDGLLRNVEFTTTGTPSIGTDVLVTYAASEPETAIATSLLTELRNAGLGGLISAPGVIDFVSVQGISVDPSSTVISASSTSVTVLDGASLTGGETVTVTDSLGNDTVFEFSKTGLSQRNADAIVPISDSDTSQAVAISLQATLAANGFGSTPTPGSGADWIVQFANVVTFSVDDAASSLVRNGNILTVPDAGNFINGETVTVTDGLGIVTVVEFNTVGTAPAATSDLSVAFNPTDDAATIASLMESVLRGQGIGLTANGADVTFNTSTDATAMAPVTSFVTSPSSIIAPEGRSIIDGEIITINATGVPSSPLTIEFSTTGASINGGSDFVIAHNPGDATNGDPGDTAATIASEIESVLRDAGIGVTASGDTLQFVNLTDIQVQETPSLPGDFPANFPSPLNEQEQALRVVAFETTGANPGTVDILVDGNGTHTLQTPAGGLLTLTFAGGAFTTGTYQPAVDYNELTPFDPSDLFTFTIEDNGQTTIPSTNEIRDLDDERSLIPATVTITVTETNDTPTFTTPTEIDILEDSAGLAVADIIQNVLPSTDTALDEIATQSVVFSIDADASTIPDGLMSALPVIDQTTGAITFFPAQDAVGTAVYVIVGEDTDQDDPRSTLATLTVNVQPVNDAPRFNSQFVNTSDVDDADDAYRVGEILNGQAPITYTLAEDNTQPLGVTTPYFIPLRRDPSIVGYNRVGLLDVFIAGPANELDATDGGDQVLRLLNFDNSTSLGGSIEAVTSGGQIIGLNYTPPINYNNEIGEADEFTYTVEDNSTPGGETFSLVSGTLEQDLLTTTNTVRLDLNPVNDRPEFSTNTLQLETAEDTDLVTIPNFAFNISAGPSASAFDEIDVSTGQSVEFSLALLDVPASQASFFFSEFPAITPDGTLTFQPAADVYGTFEFEVVLTDNGPGNETRGDLISSEPVVLTLDIRPVNDAPIRNPDSSDLEFTILEDGSIDILVSGDTVNSGLLDAFLPGPANEAQAISPGGNQTVAMAEPIVASTAEGGTLRQIFDNGELTHLRYTPRANFVGEDSFIYTVVDNGESVDIGTDGLAVVRPRFASNTVILNVLPLNDEPQFSGASNVTSAEDQGTVFIQDWANNVQAGPPTAADELAQQQLEFVITQVSGDPNLFAVPPQATISGSSADLTYETAPDANGVALFEVFLRDNGPDTISEGNDNQSDTQTFLVTIDPVNDSPTFSVLSSAVTVDEDSGPYNEPWAADISPGPADEATQNVRFEVTYPIGFDPDSLFLEGMGPTISDSGILRFTPQPNANGSVNLVINAVDSLDARSEDIGLEIVINEVNDAPVANSDTFSTDEDTVLVITQLEMLANDTDPDLATNPNEVLVVTLAGDVTSSIEGARVSIDPDTGNIIYDPTVSNGIQAIPEDGTLIDSFAYSLRDAAGVSSNPVTVSVNLTGVNDAPTLNADNPTLNIDGTTIIRPLENDRDIDVDPNPADGVRVGGVIDPSTLRLTFQPAFGSVAIDSNGVITYTPFNVFSTEDQFGYTVADDLGLVSEEAIITVAANAVPVTNDDIASTFIETPVVIDVAANDRDTDGQLDLTSISVVRQPLRGEAIPLNNGTVRYVPEPGFIGTETFDYIIADQEGRFSEPETVEVRVLSSRLQNPARFQDVNADGDISPLDALLIVNALSARQNEFDIRLGGIPVRASDVGPSFLDANGDGKISPQDALDVIDELARRARAGLFGEQVVLDLDPSNAQGELVTTDEPTAALPVSDSKIVGLPESDSVDSAVIDLIAGNEDSDEDDRVQALDAAFGDLL